MSTKEESPIDKFRSTVISAAADAMVKEMTEQQMRACAEEVVKKALGDLNTDRYGPLGSQVTEAAKQMMREYLATEKAKTLIRQAVEDGVGEALKTMSAEIRGKVIDTAIKAMVSALSTKDSRW